MNTFMDTPTDLLARHAERQLRAPATTTIAARFEPLDRELNQSSPRDPGGDSLRDALVDIASVRIEIETSPLGDTIIREVSACGEHITLATAGEQEDPS